MFRHAQSHILKQILGKVVVKRSVMKKWNPSSWQEMNASQQANYPDENQLSNAVDELKLLPPIVTSWDVDKLDLKEKKLEEFI